MRAMLLALLRNDDGAVIVEYAVILALLTAVGIAAMEVTAAGANTQLNNDQTNLSSMQTAP